MNYRRFAGAGQESRFCPANHEVVGEMLRAFPGVREGRMFGYPAFFIGRRMFACVYGAGVGLKLPDTAVRALLARPGVIHFQPHGRRPMREWVQINRKRAPEYRRDRPLFEQSIRFVSGGGGQP
jgi:TfoX N-terminal domain